jgi:hypothetical protein
VAEDADPIRLALAYATTFVAGNGAYCFHPGSGIRGGGQNDLARGRQANLYDEDPAVWAALATMRRILPAGVANWARVNSQWAEFPWDGSQRAVDRGDIVRAFAATSGDQLVAVILGAARAHEVTAREGLDLTFYHPVTGDAVHRVLVGAGQTFEVPADLSGYLVIGTRGGQ